jgi:UDP-N-acetylmuramoyl-tripeptide--D-alanyl-D-alanine ligase
MTLTLGQIADWIHAEGVFDTTAEALGYAIDSRTVGAGELFFAVKGERDGHDFVPAAIANGAVAAVVSQRWLPPAGFDQARLVRVPDECEDCVLNALQMLAHHVRRAWGKRVIGITGSAGKTTTKECVAQVLGARFHVLKTEGNFNNHLGVPLTLLRLEPEHDVAVIEMGMNHAGEIRALAKIAQPEWAVVSNVAAVHTEHFVDGIEGVARAKFELVASLPADGMAVLNGDDERVSAFGIAMGKRAVRYGFGAANDVRAEEFAELGLEGSRLLVAAGQAREHMHLRLMGRHNVMNALSAIAVGLQSGLPLAECCRALEALRPSARRGDVLAWRGAKLINDCYNSNPKALQAMVDALAQTAATRRIVIAGEMLELGAEAVELHRACGRAMAAAHVDVLVGVRGLASEIVAAAKSAGVEAVFVASPQEAGAWMQQNLREGDVVLLKASRGVRLERALEALGTA